MSARCNEKVKFVGGQADPAAFLNGPVQLAAEGGQDGHYPMTSSVSLISPPSRVIKPGPASRLR